MPEVRLTESLEQLVGQRPWYQSLVLPGGVVTAGQWDTSDELSRIPFPSSLKGMRCLDVATAEGFWAFEMERRGASEVVAIDVNNAANWDWPGNTSRERRLAYDSESQRPDHFDIAHEALGSKVQRRTLSVYQLAPEEIGEFDFVFIGSVLLHLRDPVAALTAIGSVLRGKLLSVDAVSPPLTAMHPWQPIARFEAHGYPVWWACNLRAYRRLFDAAAFEISSEGRPFFVRRGAGYEGVAPGKGGSLYQRARQRVVSRFGLLHSWVIALPRSRRL